MSRRFGDCAVRLYGTAARVLGWRPPEFWAATPAELLAALFPAEAGADGDFDRIELNRLMDQDNA